MIPDLDQGDGSGDPGREGNECTSLGAKAESTHETQAEGDFTIITARARKEIRASTINEGKTRLRLTNKTNAIKWKEAAHRSSTIPRLYQHGPANTFDFADRCHPWANICKSHEVWFCDLIAFCRKCGATSSKKGTLQKRCKGMKEREKGKAETQGGKVVRLMSQGKLPPGHVRWPGGNGGAR